MHPFFSFSLTKMYPIFWIMFFLGKKILALFYFQLVNTFMHVKYYIRNFELIRNV